MTAATPTPAASSSRRTKAPITESHADLSNVNTNPDQSLLVDITSELEAQNEEPESVPSMRPANPLPRTRNYQEGGAQGTHGYINFFEPLLLRMKGKHLLDINQQAVSAMMEWLQDDSDKIRLNNAHALEALKSLQVEAYVRYSRQALTLAIYLGKTQGMGVSRAKAEISRGTGIKIGETSSINGFPTQDAFKYSVVQFEAAFEFLNEHYGDNGVLIPGAISASTEYSRQNRVRAAEARAAE